jgi:tetratricopeptide (TPR) repeat protein
MEMIRDKPVLGLGIGAFSYHYLDYQAAYLLNHPAYIKYSGKAAEAHNEYLHLAAETGIVGLVSFLAIIFVFYYLVYQYLEREEDKDDKIIIFGLLMGITCFLTHCLFTFPFHVPVLGSTFFILLGLTMANINLAGGNKGNDSAQNVVLIQFKSNALFLKIVIVMLIIMAVAVLWEIALKPYLAELNYFPGAKYFAEQDNDTALEYFKKAALYDTKNGRIMHALGSAYYQLDLQEEAQQILQKTIQIYKDRNTFRNLGLSYRQSGDFKQAEKQFQQAIYLDPKFYEAYHDLASLYIYQNEYEKAIEQWQRAIDLGLAFEEKHIFLYYIGLGYQRLSRQEEAYKYFLAALKEAPDDSSILKDIEQELLNIYLNDNI